jgi:hypothetical protein
VAQISQRPLSSPSSSILCSLIIMSLDPISIPQKKNR